MDVIAPDVILVADGGGIVPAIRVPVHGAERVARFIARAHRNAPGLDAATVWLNGAPAGRVGFGDERSAAISLELDGGLITRIYVTVNPHKLARLDEPVQLTTTA
jgi:RNA polymerase sigma-70 factor (ECF subfamily)